MNAVRSPRPYALSLVIIAIDVIPIVATIWLASVSSNVVLVAQLRKTNGLASAPRLGACPEVIAGIPNLANEGAIASVLPLRALPKIAT